MDSLSPTSSVMSRRLFLGAAASVAAAPLLSACGGGGSQSSAQTVAFWDMAWGAPAYTSEAGKLTGSYVPKKGLGKASYQSVQWADSYQKFASAIASGTGPAVSTNATFQPFQFADQDAIVYADDVIAALRKSGAYDDFLPGTIEGLKTTKGYAAVPWCLDTRVMWYSKPLLAKADVDLPTDWDSLITVGKALKKIGVSGFGLGAGSGNAIAKQAIHSLLINNGGGFFDEEGKPNCVTDRNIETLEFLREMTSAGIISPAMAAYSQADLSKGWTSGQIGMGIHVPDLYAALGVKGDDFAVANPLTGPHGDKGTVTYVNSITMYKGAASQAASEAFVLWYLDQMKVFWQQGLVQVLPVRQSIAAMPEFQKNTGMLTASKEWQPIAKPFSAPSKTPAGYMNAINSGQALATFVQQVVLGKTAPKDALTALQKGMKQDM
jgi:multiple sugar transport system substrate-binding protein